MPLPLPRRRRASSRPRTSLLAVVTVLVSTMLLSATSAFADSSWRYGDLEFGVYTGGSGQSLVSDIRDIEDDLGQSVDVVRLFDSWDSNFPSSAERKLSDEGRMLMVSIKPLRDGQIIPWGEIAAAHPGDPLHDDMLRWGQRIKSVGKRVHVIFHHEPESRINQDFGSSDEFKAAHRRFVDTVRSAGADNARFVWTMTEWAFRVDWQDRRAAFRWYPGGRWVNTIGADAYNWFGCRPGQYTDESFRTMVKPVVDFAEKRDKRVWLPEIGIHDPGGATTTKADWIEDARTTLKQPAFQRIRGVVWYDEKDVTGGRQCEWWFDSSPSAVHATARLAYL